MQILIDNNLIFNNLGKKLLFIKILLIRSQINIYHVDLKIFGPHVYLTESKSFRQGDFIVCQRPEVDVV